MADIAKVTGTLDDAELNFSHSVGTVYKATASIDGSEKDHVAVVTATDSAGNSTTETMVVSISGSWTTPKTDWYGYTDGDGIYHGDRFNTEDFNRIKNNLAYLREIAVAMYQEFSINDLGDDRSKPGDILVTKSKGHTVIVVSVDGSAPSGSTSTSKPAVSGSIAKVESARSKDAAIAGKYKTTSNLYLRVGAGTGKAAITLMPAGSSVQCYGYYTTYNGTRWYYVVYGDKTGFCSSAYLQKA